MAARGLKKLSPQIIAAIIGAFALVVATFIGKVPFLQSSRTSQAPELSAPKPEIGNFTYVTVNLHSVDIDTVATIVNAGEEKFEVLSHGNLTDANSSGHKQQMVVKPENGITVQIEADTTIPNLDTLRKKVTNCNDKVASDSITTVSEVGLINMRFKPIDVFNETELISRKHFAYVPGGFVIFRKQFKNEFEITKQEIVVDKTTGLIWERNGSEEVVGNLVGAEKYIRQLNRNNFGGYNDWRLPTAEELTSIMSPTKDYKSNSYMEPIFPRKTNSIATSDFADKLHYGYSWLLNISNGLFFRFDNDSQIGVRAVRKNVLSISNKKLPIDNIPKSGSETRSNVNITTDCCRSMKPSDFYGTAYFKNGSILQYNYFSTLNNRFYLYDYAAQMNIADHEVAAFKVNKLYFNNLSKEDSTYLKSNLFNYKRLKVIMNDGSESRGITYWNNSNYMIMNTVASSQRIYFSYDNIDSMTVFSNVEECR